MKNTSMLKAVAVALALILASSALSSVAMAQKPENVGSRADAEKLINEAERLAAKAHELLARAEEQGSDAAIDEVEGALKWISEAESLIENGDLKEAKSALHEARSHLKKAEKLLGTHESSRKGDGHDISKRAEQMMERAMKLQSLAEEKEDERALEVLDKAIHLIKSAVEEASDGDVKEARSMLAEATKMLNAVQAMLSATHVHPTPKQGSPEDRKEKVIKKAEHLMERAEHLNALAEEHGNEEAIEAIGRVMQMLEEAVQTASEGDLKEATTMLVEATKMLNRVGAMLGEPAFENPRPKPTSPVREDPAKMLAQIAEELGEKAARIQSIAEEQENTEALAEVEKALELVTEAKRLIKDEDYEHAKAELREASDHLSRASSMLGHNEVIRTENSARFIRDRDVVKDTARDIFKARFGLEGSGYAVLKNPDGAESSLYSTEISMQGIALEESRSAFHFVVNDVVITVEALTPITTASEDVVELTSVDAWDLKARKGGHLFVTRGDLEDADGNTYRVKLRGLLIDASSQGLVFKVDGRIHHSDRPDAEENNYLFANLHYLAIVKAAA